MVGGVQQPGWGETDAPSHPQPLVGTGCPAWRVAADVPDPEIGVVTIGDLGFLRDITCDDRQRVHVQIAPTYPGCPTVEAIRTEVIDALTDVGYRSVSVEFVFDPAWSSDEISDEGRRKLSRYGLAPPSTEPARLLG